MMVGIACLVYLSINLGNVDLFGSDSFMIDAKFGSIEGLEVAASVEIAGVPVGKVKRITLEENEAFVQMEIKKGTNHRGYYCFYSYKRHYRRQVCQIVTRRF